MGKPPPGISRFGGLGKAKDTAAVKPAEIDFLAVLTQLMTGLTGNEEADKPMAADQNEPEKTTGGNSGGSGAKGCPPAGLGTISGFWVVPEAGMSVIQPAGTVLDSVLRNTLLLLRRAFLPDNPEIDWSTEKLPVLAGEESLSTLWRQLSGFFGLFGSGGANLSFPWLTAKSIGSAGKSAVIAADGDLSAFFKIGANSPVIYPEQSLPGRAVEPGQTVIADAPGFLEVISGKNEPRQLFPPSLPKAWAVLQSNGKAADYQQLPALLFKFLAAIGMVETRGGSVPGGDLTTGLLNAGETVLSADELLTIYQLVRAILSRLPAPAESAVPGGTAGGGEAGAGSPATGVNSTLLSPVDVADFSGRTGGRDKFEALNTGVALFNKPVWSMATTGTVQTVNLLQLPLLVARVLEEAAARQAQGRTHLRFRLEPEHLGEVVVRLIYRHGEVSAHFLAGSVQAKEVLESSLPQLREALAGQNLHLQNTSVSVGQESGFLPREDYHPVEQYYSRWEKDGGSPGDDGGSAAAEQRAGLLRTGINLIV